MLSIDKNPAIDYCRNGNNLLDAAVHFTVVKTNANYQTAPDVVFSGGSGITAATGHAVLDSGGHISEIVIDTAGSGYSVAPTITIGGVATGGGAGGAATAILGTDDDDDKVVSVTITNSGGYRITFKDNTAYDTGNSEARAAVNISLFDHSGGKAEYQITAADGDDTIDADLAGLNATDGIDGIVTVVSNLNNKKDGSIYDLVTIRQDGNFVMEI